jgi:ABC-type polar amino acid transport system ATPase subunit
MEISYKGNVFDTTKNIEIQYLDDSDIVDFVEALIESVKEKGELQSLFGFVSRRFPFISNLSIMENIILPLEYHTHMSVEEAVEKIRVHVESLGLENVVSKRKEKVSNEDIYKAMFLRATVMDPEVVFICDFKYAVTLKEFGNMLPLFRRIIGPTTKLWIGVSEGHSIEWEHDLEVSLDT